MVRWRPINYKLPSTVEEWNTEFEQYKLYPEYLLRNDLIDLERFKFIFFIEWAHRTLGNVIGCVFTLPLLYFGFKGY